MAVAAEDETDSYIMGLTTPSLSSTFVSPISTSSPTTVLPPSTSISTSFTSTGTASDSIASTSSHHYGPRHSDSIVNPDDIFAEDSAYEFARGRTCPPCTSLADSLYSFIAAYQPPAVILYQGATVPWEENEAFLSLRCAHPILFLALVTAVGRGRRRVSTSFGETRIRWTITTQPTTGGQARQAIVLGHDEGGEEDEAERLEEDFGQDEPPTYSTVKGDEAYDNAALSIEIHSVSQNKDPANIYLPPSSSRLSPPNRLSSHSNSVTPQAIIPDRSWLLDPHFSAITSGGGEMGDLIRSLDWSQTLLGPVPSWSPTLLGALGVLLRSRFPSAIYWGPHAVMLYNTPYISALGAGKHPHALGRPVRDIWEAEVWDAIGPPIQDALEGRGCYHEDNRFLLGRIGSEADAIRDPETSDTVVGRSNSPSPEVIEEAHYTWSLIPLYQPSGLVGGVYNPVHDVTGKVRSERRLRNLCTLAARLFTARTTSALFATTCEVLAQLEDDMPYVAAYALQRDDVFGGETISHDHQERLTEPQEGKPITFILQETVGIPFDAPAAPSKLIVDPSAHSSSPEDWPIDLRSLVAQHKLGIHRGIAALMSSLPMRGHAYSGPTRAASLPIVHGKVLVGFVLVFLSGALPVDEHMLIFLDLLSRQISTSASMVASYEHEVAKLEEMAAIDHAKTAFFTNISHELRTPLTLILGPVSELLNGSASTGSGGALPSGARTQLDIVERNAKRLLRLVNTIMDFATAEAGRTTSTFTPTALGEYTADLASAFRSAAGLADLVYIVDIAKIPNGLLVYVDRDKWEKIVYNLLSNAIKYTLAGSVHVRAYVDTTGKANASAEVDLSLGQDRFVLEVEDTGVGIPSGELGSVFDKFHRARTSQGRSIEGTGIGLAYTLELVKAHRGVVTVESTPGKGSKFRVHLLLGKAHLPPGSVLEKDHVAEWVMTPPLSDPSVVGGLAVGRYMDELVQMLPPSEAETSSESQTFSSDVLWQPLIFGDRERARILVADDNADMRRYVSGLLSRYCDVHAVSDGAKALAELHAYRMNYDLVLSDDMMPYMTGSELLAAVRNDAALRTVPFIIISAKAGDEARMEGLALGADDYLAKPFQAKELLLRVHTQLQSASVRNELELRLSTHLRSLEESRESFTRLCERLQVGIHRADGKGALTWTNRKWANTIGPEWDCWGRAIDPEDLARATDAYNAAIESKVGYAQPLELRVRDSADQYIDIIYDLQPEFSSDTAGQLLGWVGVWSDVTALRSLQRFSVEAERAHTREAERNRELQEQFIDITCHELRNPLNAIYNSAALLGESLARIDTALEALRVREEGKAAHQPEFEQIHAEVQEDIDNANTIVLCARHQKRITDDVLNVSKLSAGLITLVSDDFSPFEEVKNAVRVFRDEVSARGLTLELERDASLDVLHVDRVRGDSGRFVQIVVNLLSNAIKFTETAPQRHVRICIGATEHEEALGEDQDRQTYPDWPEMDQDDLIPMCRTSSGDVHASHIRIYVAVADSGHGMTEPEQERVFQRFAQASPRTYGEFGGSGLGLYVSRMLVELHGGRIHLQSTRDVGTVLRFFIVVERALDAHPVPSASSLIQFGLEPKVASVRSVSPMPTIMLATPAGEPSNQRLRVLVVEDNLINQRLLVKLLTILDCDTHTCNDGQQCVSLLQSLAQSAQANTSSFDIILMDLEMPVMDGLAATRRIRELEEEGALRSSPPIVAVSGNARSEWTDRARDAGMDGFLRKPYSKAELQELLGRWRTGRRML